MATRDSGPSLWSIGLLVLAAIVFGIVIFGAGDRPTQTTSPSPKHLTPPAGTTGTSGVPSTPKTR
jgi:hypothetical protein